MLGTDNLMTYFFLKLPKGYALYKLKDCVSYLGWSACSGRRRISEDPLHLCGQRAFVKTIPTILMTGEERFHILKVTLAKGQTVYTYKSLHQRRVMYITAVHFIFIICAACYTLFATFSTI